MYIGTDESLLFTDEHRVYFIEGTMESNGTKGWTFEDYQDFNAEKSSVLDGINEFAVSNLGLRYTGKTLQQDNHLQEIFPYDSYESDAAFCAIGNGAGLLVYCVEKSSL